MMRTVVGSKAFFAPSFGALLELTKPITWFAPIWAFGCGVLSAGVDLSERWPFALLGLCLAGPLVCGASQAVNDWFDRHVDAINEPDRPIPSGRVSGPWALGLAGGLTAIALLLAAAMGPWALLGTAVAVLSGWVYSAPPLRLKRSGWLGPAACALSYEGLAWFTGAAVVLGGRPSFEVIALAGLYSLGAHGIMTLNDFKAVEGDKRTDVRSLPVQLGVRPAAILASVVMAAPQAVVVALLGLWDRPVHAAIVAGLLSIQLVMMVRMIGDPKTYAPWYNATGTLFYVLGMLVSALALGGVANGGAGGVS